MQKVQTVVIFSLVAGVICALTASGFGLSGKMPMILGIVGGIVIFVIFIRINREG